MKKRVEGRDKKNAYIYGGLKICSKEDFIEWSLKHPEYLSLFETWKNSGYIRKLKPSVDRIDAVYGYELWNMQWLTLSENSKKGAISRWHGKQ